MKRIGPVPGLYEDDDGAVHIWLGDVLDAFGYADTPANRQRLADELRAMLAERDPAITMLDVLDDE